MLYIPKPGSLLIQMSAVICAVLIKSADHIQMCKFKFFVLKLRKRFIFLPRRKFEITWCFFRVQNRFHPTGTKSVFAPSQGTCRLQLEESHRGSNVQRNKSNLKGKTIEVVKIEIQGSILKSHQNMNPRGKTVPKKVVFRECRHY